MKPTIKELEETLKSSPFWDAINVDIIEYTLTQALAIARGDGWQPIETAPKDGTQVLITNGSATASCEWFVCELTPDGCWAYDALVRGDEPVHHVSSISKATRWQPLPLPPQPTESENDG